MTDFFVFLRAIAKEILKFHIKTKKTIFYGKFSNPRYIKSKCDKQF